MDAAARGLPRIVVYLAWTLALIPVQLVAVALGLRLAETLPLVYHRGVCRIVGLRLEPRGTISTARPTLFAANHASYLDIAVLGALLPASFVAKREVASWPLFGLLAKLQRSVFIDRESGRAGRHRDEMDRRLGAGDNLVLFPEGTSSDGNRVLAFKSALFGVAERPIGGRALTVQPVSVAYSGLYGLPMLRFVRPHVAWYGDMALGRHLWEFLGLGPVTATVEFHAPVTIETLGSRKALAAHCYGAVAAGLAAALHGGGARPAAS